MPLAAGVDDCVKLDVHGYWSYRAGRCVSSGQSCSRIAITDVSNGQTTNGDVLAPSAHGPDAHTTALPTTNTTMHCRGHASSQTINLLSLGHCLPELDRC